MGVVDTKGVVEKVFREPLFPSKGLLTLAQRGSTIMTEKMVRMSDMRTEIEDKNERVQTAPIMILVSSMYRTK